MSDDALAVVLTEKARRIDAAVAPLLDLVAWLESASLEAERP